MKAILACEKFGQAERDETRELYLKYSPIQADPDMAHEVKQ